ncbi:MAG: hypothetical protein R6V85_15030 [Polyangia bacterium]
MRLKPLRRSASVPLLERVEGCSITRFGDEALLSAAEIVSEGVVDRDRRGALYHGSTLITVRLDEARAAGRLEPVDAEQLAAAASRSLSLRVRLLRIARAELERRCRPLLPRRMTAVTEFAVEGQRLLVDIGVECRLADPVERADGSGEGAP